MVVKHEEWKKVDTYDRTDYELLELDKQYISLLLCSRYLEIFRDIFLT